MTRRVAGVVLLLAVVLASLVISRIGGVRVGGTAVAAPGATVPAVGDCLGDVTGPLTIPSLGAFPPSPSSVASVGETSVTFTDCGGQHVGEVVAYRSVPGPGEGAAGTPVSDGEWCREVAAGYRSHSIWRFRSASEGLWEPSTGQRFVAILSAPVQRSWAACAVVSPGLESYVGSFVQSLADQPAPAPFGHCRSDDPIDRWVSCTSPHRVQEFGTAVTGGMSPRAAIEACRSLIEQMTGLRDVNAGGVLRVVVVGGGLVADGGADGSAAGDSGGGVGGGDFGADDSGGGFGGADARGDESELGRCRLGAVAPNQLVGTLIGIGNGPLPLA
jgi:hypothetical protein